MLSVYNDCEVGCPDIKKCPPGPPGEDGKSCADCFPYLFDDTVNAGGVDPGSSNINFNNAALSSATQMYISDIDGSTANIGNFLATIDDSTSSVKGHVKITSKNNVDNFIMYEITGSSVDNTTYWCVVITYLEGDGTFVDTDEVCVCFSRTGDKGESGGGSISGCWVIYDKKNAGTDGGTFIQNVWITRVLNTIESAGVNAADVSIAGNQMTFQMGTYKILGQAPAIQVKDHKARIRNITDGVTEIIGTSARNRDFASIGHSHISGILSIVGSAKVLELQHRCEQSRNGDGFGVANGFDEDEIYSRLTIFKL